MSSKIITTVFLGFDLINLIIYILNYFRLGLNNSDLSSLIYTGSEDGTIKLWDLRLKDKCVSIYKGKN